LIEPLPVRQQSPEREQATILVVEDEVLIRIVLADELRMAGFHALEAANADEALALLAAAPEITLVFTDIRMPGSIDGLELTRAVRARWPHIKVIVASGAQLPVHAERSWDATLQKPYDVPDVLRCVRTLLGGTQTPAATMPDAPGAGAIVLDPSVAVVMVAAPAAPEAADPTVTDPDPTGEITALTADAIKTMPVAAIAQAIGVDPAAAARAIGATALGNGPAGNGAPAPDAGEAASPEPPPKPS
jgi:CheY-like chemotaxis protein